MEIQQKLKVPATYFYESVIRSVIHDIDQSTGRVIEKDQLQGFEYSKTFSDGSQAKMTIEKAKENREYQFRTVTSRNEFVASYTITPIDEENCEVNYHESITSEGMIQQINDLLVGWLLGYFKKKQFKAMLESIESSY